MQSFPLKSHLEGKIVYYNITLWSYYFVHKHCKRFLIISNIRLLRNTIWWILYEMTHITFKLKISNFPASILLSIPNDTYKSAILLRHVRIGFQDVYWIPSKLHLLSFVSLDTAWKNVRSSDIRLTKLYMRPYLNI